MRQFIENAKKRIKRSPVARTLAGKIYVTFLKQKFPGSEKYWIKRYEKGGNSGPGSYNQLAQFKAKIINHFVQKNNIKSIIECGCGDGNQLRLAKYPQYLGLDVSREALSRCRDIFHDDNSKLFKLMIDYSGEVAELTLSLEVICHLIEDDVFDRYMRDLFSYSGKYVIIYSSNTDIQERSIVQHFRHRKFTDWIQENRSNWKLIKKIKNRYPYKNNEKEESYSDFYFYKKHE